MRTTILLRQPSGKRPLREVRTMRIDKDIKEKL